MGKNMKKILAIAFLGFFILSGLGAVAIPNEEKIENKTRFTEDRALEIKVKGGILGYQVTVENVGNGTVKGNLTMNITTNAWIILRGQNLQFPLCPLHLDLSTGEKEIYNPGPVIGFGPTTITIDGKFTFEETENPYQFKTNGTGFIFLIFNTCDTNLISLP
jgi:hypothetical protein